MLGTILVLLVLTGLVLYWVQTRKPRMSHIPGPKGHPLLGALLLVDTNNIHKQLVSWSKIYGSVFRLQLADKTRIAVNDFDTIYKVLVTQGKEFAGRPIARRSTWMMNNTGILISTEPDLRWRSLRKASHRHLKQFGDGMSRLEAIITEVAEDMFSAFEAQAGKPFDPHQIIFDTALNNIFLLITGIRPHAGDPLVEKMRKLEFLVPKYVITAELKYFIYEVLPSLRSLRLSGWRDIESVFRLEEEVWNDIEELHVNNPHLESLVSVLKHHLQADREGRAECHFSELDIRKTAVSLLFAGVTTTSASFYAGVNILAHNPQVQDTIHKEITSIVGERSVSLSDRTNMPYSHAFLLELLRYVSVVPMGIPHRTLVDVTLNGYKIPKNTIIYTNLWAMHHEESFWGDPYVFRPERFLDDDGALVPADHPNRRHLMPFGAGTRVCLGESLGLARLFLWFTTLIQRYKVTPADGNPLSATDPRNFSLEAVLRVTRYSVVLTSR